MRVWFAYGLVSFGALIAGLLDISRLGAHALPAVIVTGDTAAERLREFDGIAASVLHKPVDGRKLALALRDATGC